MAPSDILLLGLGSRASKPSQRHAIYDQLRDLNFGVTSAYQGFTWTFSSGKCDRQTQKSLILINVLKLREKKENILKVNENLINVSIDYKRILLVREILTGRSVWFHIWQKSFPSYSRIM